MESDALSFARFNVKAIDYGSLFNSSNNLIGNVETQLDLWEVEGFKFPVSINKEVRQDNSYVVSPHNAYGAYAQYELMAHLSAPWRWPLQLVLFCLSSLLAWARVDNIVQINNWLLSTNLYPTSWSGRGLETLIAKSLCEYPHKALCFRSLNEFSNHSLIEALQCRGFIAVPSRQVYLYDGREGASSAFLKRHNVQMDMQLLTKSHYRIEVLESGSDTEWKQIEYLYSLLYRDKYCTLNPQFSAEWIRSCHSRGILQVQVLRNERHHIDGVVGFFENESIITAPLVGYDIHLPQKLGLYRMLSALCFKRAIDSKRILNFSSGAAHFKRLRGGRAEIEFSFVYTRHLSLFQQCVWRILALLLINVGVPIMKILKL